MIVTANQKDGYNILEVQRPRSRAAVARFENGLPKRITLERGFDQARNVDERLSRLYTDFGIAIALVSLTLLPLGWRAAGIVMVSIPLSLAFGLTVLYFLGYSLNQISIAGFVVALGLLVDDSIVVVENIARHLREGNSRIAGRARRHAADLRRDPRLHGDADLRLPAAAWRCPAAPGKFIRVLPVTVVAAIVGSLLIALFIIPFLASRVLEGKRGRARQSLPAAGDGRDPSLLPPGTALLPRAPEGDGRSPRSAARCCCRRRSCPSSAAACSRRRTRRSS